jgi:hypothetical protein
MSVCDPIPGWRGDDSGDAIASAFAEEGTAGEIKAACGDGLIATGLSECIAEQLFFFCGRQIG